MKGARKPRHGKRSRSGAGGAGGVADSAPATGRTALWAAGGAGIALLVALLAFDPFLFTGGDNARYYALAEALATGRGYVDLVAPGAPPHTLYPPGYATLLVPVYLLSGGSIVALKGVSWLAAGLLLGALYRLARRDPAVPGWAAPAAVTLVGLYPAFQEYSHWMLSDMPYAAIATAALWAVDDPGAGESDPPPWPRWAAACGLALLAFYLRTAGATLLIAVVLGAAVRRRWGRAAAAAGGLAAGVAPWILWSRHAAAGAGSGSGYVQQLAAHAPATAGPGLIEWFGDRVGAVLVEYGTYQLPMLFWPADPPPLTARVLGATVGGALLLYGAWRLARARGVRTWDLYVLLTLGLLPFWPWLGERFVLTVVPFVWLYLLTGADGVGRRFLGGPRAAIAFAGGVALVLLAGAVREAGRQIPLTRAYAAGSRFAGYDRFWSEYFRSAEWIGENAPDAIVLARKPALTWYWSGRPAVVPPRADPAGTWDYVRRTGVTHLLLDPRTEDRMREALAARRPDLELVHRSPSGLAAVVRVDRSALR